MKKEKISLKEFFENDQEFAKAVADAQLLEKLKTPSKFSIEVEDLEEKIFKLVSNKEKFILKVLFVNYKRYLYNHILEIEKIENK